MPPQIQQEINKSGWETTDFPSVCERCLPDNPFVQMIREDFGKECKICSRPFTVFRWKADRTARQRQTNMCLTCAKLKNCCQCCMLDLAFGLTIPVRDAALKMIAPGPKSDINKQWYAQVNETEIAEGRGPLDAYQKTDEKARDLLRRLANSEPHYKRQRREEEEAETANKQLALESPAAQKVLTGPSTGESSVTHIAGPVRTRDNPTQKNNRTANQGGRPFPGTSQIPPNPADIEPPADRNVVSLFVTGVEDDLPQHEIEKHFSQFGKLRSVTCSHRAHCAFINYQTRAAAEVAAAACQGKAKVKGVPLRVRWGKPKPLDTMDHEERMKNAKEGRQQIRADKRKHANIMQTHGGLPDATTEPDLSNLVLPAAPGEEPVSYPSMEGN